MSLGTKYRPKTFNDVVGQLSTVQILRKQIQTENIRNTYIFAGSSGCGKTTMARIFASELNGMPDTAIEIDAASNNGVDNIREINRSARERSISCKYKIFILDEAHMLTNQSWNALLKTIEETPKYTIFIFCTTNPEKIPDTIKNRCQRFEFTKIASSLIEERLKYVCNQEGFTNFDESCEYISKNCKNQMRDALTILEQVSDFDHNLDINTTIRVSGSYYYKNFFNLINHILDGDFAGVISEYNNITITGINSTTLVNALLRFELDINKYIIFRDISFTSLPLTHKQDVDNVINFDNPIKIHSYFLNVLTELRNIRSLDEDIVLAYLLKMTRLDGYDWTNTAN